MIQIFGININESIETDNIHILLQYVSPEKAQKIKNFRDKRVSYRSILGEILVRYSVCMNNKCTNKDIEINFKKNQKPTLIFPKNLNFNISHSEDWVLCAISDKIIGIDVEYMKKADIDIAKRFFTDLEYEYIIKSNNENELKQKFYKVWTLKESYIKAIGKGLSLPLKSFSMLFNDNQISVDQDEKYYFKTFGLENNYIVSVCSVFDCFCEEIKIIQIQDVLNFFGGHKI